MCMFGVVESSELTWHVQASVDAGNDSGCEKLIGIIREEEKRRLQSAMEIICIDGK